MANWEYRVVDSKEVSSGGLFKAKDRQAVEAYLNSLGKEGWEIINIDFRELEGRMSFTGIAKRILD